MKFWIDYRGFYGGSILIEAPDKLTAKEHFKVLDEGYLMYQSGESEIVIDDVLTEEEAAELMLAEESEEVLKD